MKGSNQIKFVGVRRDKDINKPLANTPVSGPRLLRTFSMFITSQNISRHKRHWNVK